jgi:transposase
MLTQEFIMQIRDLKAQGLSLKAIARQTGHSRNTVRKVLRQQHTGRVRAGPIRPSKLDAFAAHVQARHTQYGLSAVRLHEEVRAMGFTGSVHTVRRFLRPWREERQRQRLATTRFETPPGHQAQADWGELGAFPGPDGKLLNVYVFVMVLGHSRKMFIHFTLDMKLPTLLHCHQLAFAYFGGVPRQILYDNMKQVRLGPNRLHEAFVDFSSFHGFVPKTHRPYRPRTKGKVERQVHFVKDNFLLGREFFGMADLNARGLSWLEQTANARVHGTTGLVPGEVFARVEAAALTPYASFPPYTGVVVQRRKVSAEAVVRHRRSEYMVAPEHIGCEVEVLAVAGRIRVRQGDTVIADHPVATRPGQRIATPEQVAALSAYVARQLAPDDPPPLCHIRFDAPVQRVELSRYDEVAS